MKQLVADEIIFEAKPEAVPYNYRINYKVFQIGLIIFLCCGRGGCTLVKLHIISNALNTKSYMKLLDEYVCDKRPWIIVRFDPAVNRAIKYAIADGIFIQQNNGKFRLSPKGKELIKKVEKEKELLVAEKEYLLKLGTKLTDEKIEKLISYWRYKNADAQPTTNRDTN